MSSARLGLDRVHIVTFADTRWRGSRQRFRAQAKKFGFRSVRVLTENRLDRGFRRKNRSRLNTEVRGYGYWVWKPHVILRRLSQLPAEDILVYADVGFHIRSEGIGWFFDYLQDMQEDNADLVVFQATKPEGRPYWDGRWVPYLPDAYWTKGDLLDYFGMRESPEVHKPTIGSGLLFIRNTLSSREFLTEWQEVVSNLHLVDDSPSISANLDGFIENRHDQAALSLLIKAGSARISTQNAFDYWFPLPGGIYWKADWRALSDSPFWARRDLREHREISMVRRVKNSLYLATRRLENYTKRRLGS